MIDLRSHPSAVITTTERGWHPVPRVIVVVVPDACHTEAPLDAAFSIGQAVGARVVVVHVADLDREGEDTLDLESLVNAARARTGVRLPSEELVLLGEPVACLTRFIELERADLLVLARWPEPTGHGRRPAGTDGDGGLAAICARSAVPVLVVPVGAGQPATVEPGGGCAI